MFPHRLPSLARLVLSLALLGAAGTGYDAVAQKAPVVPPPPAPVAPATSARPLTAELVYRMLVGDIALQRGAPALAARAYYEAARDSQDAQIARRATEVALFARQRDLALEAARLWSKLDPSADRAKQMIATL